MRNRLLAAALLVTACAAVSLGQKREMNMMDVMQMRQIASRDLSSDGRMTVFALSAVEWKSGRAYSDIYIAPTSGAGMRQMTYTRDKNETSPKWSPDGKSFAFLSDRDAAPAGSTGQGGRNQLYIMRADGGEALRLTDDKEGVERFDFSRDGKWIAFTAGKQGERQLYVIGPEGGTPSPLTKHETGVVEWHWAPNSKTIYFTAPSAVDKLDKQRVEKKFDVRIHNQQQPPRQLWAVDVATKKETQLAANTDYSISSFTVSRDGLKIAFRGASPNRYATGQESEVYLFDVGLREVVRVTDNTVGEEQMSFSPDSEWLAFGAPEQFTLMRNTQLYVVSSGGGAAIPLIQDTDIDPSGFFWSRDSKSIYFGAGVGVNNQLFVVSAEGGKPLQVTRIEGVVGVLVDDDQPADTVLLSFSDPAKPADLYASTYDGLSNPAAWKKITDANPQVGNLNLGQYETVRWKSSDGVTVEGILVKPIGYREGQRYPLIVQLHGGPAGAYVNSFSGNYGTYIHVFAGNGYAVFQPNYRGSTNYGEKFKMQIAGDYFRQGYDDIITGVDYLIGRGIADPDKLGMMGWSAGGHWSNWTLTHTDRFKAISSGAGAVNWISMYAETDVQVPREFYFKGKPYDNWDHYLAVSPLKYIKNAKTPTLIHVGEADQRVPMPQSLELHMALKKLGVPTELITYPGMPHGISNPRYQFVKMASEFAWFEKWIKGKPGWLDWKTVLDTLKDDEASSKEKPEPANGDSN